MDGCFNLLGMGWIDKIGGPGTCELCARVMLPRLGQGMSGALKTCTHPCTALVQFLYPCRIHGVHCQVRSYPHPKATAPSLYLAGHCQGDTEHASGCTFLWMTLLIP